MQGLPVEDLVGEQGMTGRVRVTEGVFGVERKLAVDGLDAFGRDHAMLWIKPTHQMPGALGVPEKQGVQGRRRNAIRPPVGPFAPVRGNLRHGVFEMLEELDQGGGTDVDTVPMPDVPLTDQLAGLIPRGPVVGKEGVAHQGQGIVRVAGVFQVSQRGEEFALGQTDVAHVLVSVFRRQVQAGESQIGVRRVIAHQTQHIRPMVGKAVPDEHTLAGWRFPIERREWFPERDAAVVGVDVGREVAHARLGQQLAESPGEAVDVAAHAGLEPEAFLPGKALRGLQGRTEYLLVEQLGQVKIAGSQFHQARFHRMHQPPALLRRRRAQELLERPESLDGVLEPGFGTTLLLGPAQRHLNRLPHETPMKIGDDLLPVRETQIDVRMLDHEQFPSSARRIGGPSRLGLGLGRGPRGQRPSRDGSGSEGTTAEFAAGQRFTGRGAG